MTNPSNIDIELLARRIVELGGNAGVTQRCVPLASGALRPDSRVNYEFGLVLGVDEFRQEQFYHLQKDYLHNRALHGYGVVSGLEVYPERTDDNAIRINVRTGVGVDQCGRTFIVRDDQCAYLRAWLERNRQSLELADGPLTLYVVGTYDECKDALVAIAGQPCASSDQSLAPSRIRDSFNITLSARPPAMPAWQAIRRLAALMTRVRIINELPDADSDEAAIIERIRVIDDPAALAALPEPPDGYWRLPAAAINLTLDRIFMVWVTEVRPRFTPGVIDGCGTSDPVETGILLGRLDLQIENAAAPIQFVFADEEPLTPTISHDGRPYLLQTQLIQELLFLFGEQLPEVREFVVPTRLFTGDTPQIRLWFPFDAPSNLADTTETRGRALMITNTTTGEPLPFRIEATADPQVCMLVADVGEGRGRAAALRRLNEALNEARVLLSFHAALINVANADAQARTLLGAMTSGRYSYTGYDGEEMIVVPFVPEQPPSPGLTEAEVIRIIEQNRQPALPSVPMANLQFMSTNFDNIATFELWFHLDLDWQTYNARIDDEFTMLVLAEVIDNGRPNLAQLRFETRRVDERPNVFSIQVFTDGRPDRLQYLRFIFPVEERLGIEGEIGRFESLAEYMTAARVRFENYYDIERLTSRPAVVLYGRAITTREQ